MDCCCGGVGAAGGPEAAAAALADTSTVPTGVADIQVSRTRLLTSAAPSAPRSSAVKFITPTKSAGGTIDASEISCAGTRHSPALIRLPAVSLAPAGIPPIATVALAPGELTLTPSDSGSLTGPLPSRTTSVGAGLRCSAGNRDDVKDCQVGRADNARSTAGPCDAGKAATKTSATRAATPVATANLAAMPSA